MEGKFLNLFSATEQKMQRIIRSEEPPKLLQIRKLQSFIFECQRLLPLEEINHPEGYAEKLADWIQFLKVKEAEVSTKTLDTVEPVQPSARIAPSPAEQSVKRSNEQLVEEILKRVRQLRENNLKIQSIANEDIQKLDNTGDCIEGGVSKMRTHNKNVSTFATRTNRSSAFYWGVLFLSFFLFLISYLSIKVFPK